MRKQKSTAERVRNMIERGHTNRDIVDKLGVKPQIVYNLRYQVNKARGLGAIGKPAPKPADGIGTPPPKRKYTRRVKPAGTAGTGISVPTLTEIAYRPSKRKPEPSLWQRIVGFFRGTAHGRHA
jgi:hypothetical protein